MATFSFNILQLRSISPSFLGQLVRKLVLCFRPNRVNYGSIFNHLPNGDRLTNREK